jgi:uncharacterized protein YjbJ (UPF0337 family)
MRTLAIVAALAGFTLTAAPTVTFAQSTIEADAKTAWEQIKGSWTTTKGAVKEQWGKLTEDDLLEIEGRREKLVGKLQTRYGIPREQAEAQVSGWEHRYRSQ